MVMKIAGLGTILRLPVVGAVTLAGVGVGAIAGLVAYRKRHELLVDVTRSGIETKDAAVGAWQSAKSYAAGVKADALAPRTGADLTGEVEELRREVAALRAQIAAKK